MGLTLSLLKQLGFIQNLSFFLNFHTIFSQGPPLIVVLLQFYNK